MHILRKLLMDFGIYCILVLGYLLFQLLGAEKTSVPLEDFKYAGLIFSFIFFMFLFDLYRTYRVRKVGGET